MTTLLIGVCFYCILSLLSLASSLTSLVYLGGTGKTSIRLAKLLQAANLPVLLTSRSGNVPSSFQGVQFDWLDSTTYGNPFQNINIPIDRVYLVGPPVANVFEPMKEFIDFSITQGVKRFVLLSATVSEKGGLLIGTVHEYLADSGIDYCVLRPSWFMGAFIVPFSFDVDPT